MHYFQIQGRLKILVVEDNLGDFVLLKDYIQLSAWPDAEIVLRNTMESAIEYLADNQCHIVFLDLYLPDSSGLESFSRLKETRTAAVIIILSGLPDMKTALEAISSGADDYLTKGEFDEVLIEKTITYSIERKRNLEKLRQANERYGLVTKATHDLIWDWDLSTGEIYRDEQSVKTVYGVDGASIADLSDWNKRIHPDDAGELFGKLNEIKESKGFNFFELEYRFLSEDRNYRNIYDRVYVVRNAQGKSVRLIGAAQDITEKRRLEKQLNEARVQQQKNITEATIKGQEKEREQLGLELHDNINQILATSALYLDCALLSIPENEMIRKSRELIVLATTEIRKLSHALLPPSLGDFGLLRALDELFRPFSTTGQLSINRQWCSFPEQLLTSDQQLTIYRIVQEQLNNILKHAQAKNVSVSLLMINKDTAELLIADDGNGFDVSQKRDGVGLRNIRSRMELFDGVVSIYSKPGKGCRLSIVFPVNSENMSKRA